MIGERIKALRLQLCMTQEQFARRIQCSSNCISQIERGITKPSKRIIRSIIDSFGISDEWLTGSSGEANANVNSRLAPSKNGVAVRIRELRKESGLTQKEFGRSVGVSASAIQSIELKKRNASNILLNAIADKYQCSFEWLISGQGQSLADKETERSVKIVSDLRQMFVNLKNDDVLVRAISNDPEIISSLEKLVQHLSNNN